MISDRFPLTGTPAYLLGPIGNVDLMAVGGGAPAPFSGKSQPIGLHRVLDIDCIDLHFTAPDLTALLAQQAAPIIEVHTVKEMFNLSTDPYARRVHTIGGKDDFGRGTLSNCRAMEIEGRTTLVSTGIGPAQWISPQYLFETPIDLAELAWDFSLSRLTPPDAFRYDISLNLWSGAAGALALQPRLAVVTDVSAAATRTFSLAAPATISAIQIAFVARPVREAAIAERHASDSQGATLGMPLLEAIHLLERRDSSMVFRSLHELSVASEEFTLYGAGAAPLTAGIARLSLRAALTGSDSVEIILPTGAFLSFEARLSASLIDRPPVIHR
jgi:hypothetical protein